ncbi:MAG: hypothetical protein Hals2KO_08290 [Halioglobus sp.]
MAMKLVKKTDEYTIYQRGDERYAVKDANKEAVNGDAKARILVAEGLIKVTLPEEKPEEEAGEKSAAEEATAEEAVTEEAAAEEAPAEEAPAEEAPAEEAAEEESPAEASADDEEAK